MRNLKKVLSLALAMVMLLGMMVVGAGAAEYADAADIEYKEAAAVMTAIGVIDGMDGKFNPNGNLTRAQAAKLITYMVLGKSVADKLSNDNSKFADCPSGQWYVGSINYLSDLGIVSGRDANTFDPEGKVTGVEFAKMLLGILGYDAEIEGFVGETWASKIALVGRRAGLDADMTTSVLNTTALTRDQASQMAFNTLTCEMVYYKDGLVVDGNGDVVSGSNLARTVSNQTGKGYKVSGNDQFMQFCEMYFTELKLDNNYNETDDFGRAAWAQWQVNKESVYTRGYDLAAVFTAKTSAKDVKDALAGYSWPKPFSYEDEDGNTVTADWVYMYKNGVDDEKINGKNWVDVMTDGDDTNTKLGINELTKDGRRVEVYSYEDDNNGVDVIDRIVVIDYTLQTLTRVATAKNGDVTYTFTATDNSTKSWKNLADGSTEEVVLEGDVEAGDIVTTVVTYNDRNRKIHAFPTTEITGKQTSFNKTTGVIVVDGDQYTIADNTVVKGVANRVSENFKNGAEDTKFYVDVNGLVVKTSAPSAADTFAYIVNASTTESTSVDGDSIAVTVRAVLSDGTVGVYDLDVSTASEAKGDIAKDDYVCGDVKLATPNKTGTTVKNQVANIVGKVFQYSLDGETMTLGQLVDATGGVNCNTNTRYSVDGSTAGKDGGPSAEDPGYKGTTSYKTDGKATMLLNSKTTFVLVTGSGSKTTATVVTGISGLKLGEHGNFGQAVVSASGDKGTTSTTATAKVVFLGVEAAAAESVDYVYINAGEYVETEIDGDDMREYTGIDKNGEEVTVYGPATGKTGMIANSGLYVYDADNKVSTKSMKATSGTDMSFVSEGKNYVYGYSNALKAAGNKAQITNESGAKYYNINGDEDGTNIIYIDDTATTWENAECFVVLKSVSSGDPTEVETIYVVKAAPSAE